jgi:hypothetical protein
VRRRARLLSVDLSKKKRIHQSNPRVRGGEEGRGGEEEDKEALHHHQERAIAALHKERAVIAEIHRERARANVSQPRWELLDSHAYWRGSRAGRAIRAFAKCSFFF